MDPAASPEATPPAARKRSNAVRTPSPLSAVKNEMADDPLSDLDLETTARRGDDEAEGAAGEDTSADPPCQTCLRRMRDEPGLRCVFRPSGPCARCSRLRRRCMPVPPANVSAALEALVLLDTGRADAAREALSRLDRDMRRPRRRKAKGTVTSAVAPLPPSAPLLPAGDPGVAALMAEVERAVGRVVMNFIVHGGWVSRFPQG
ncbi:hypothetical protein VTN02DRAFT_4673 [Thermoascus thermophilus]